jgi:hypothetical protein
MKVDLVDTALRAWFEDETGAGLEGGPEHLDWRRRMQSAIEAILPLLTPQPQVVDGFVVVQKADLDKLAEFRDAAVRCRELPYRLPEAQQACMTMFDELLDITFPSLLAAHQPAALGDTCTVCDGEGHTPDSNSCDYCDGRGVVSPAAQAKGIE